MFRRSLPTLAVAVLLHVSGASARTVYVPIEPGTLGGPGIFAGAQRQVAQAAKAAGLDFTPDPKPLPPRVILPLDTAVGAVQEQNGILFWRGDMLPDQLAPAETGTLVRKRREPDGTWTTLRTREDYAPASNVNLVPVARATAHFTLPPTIIETPYQLGFLGPGPVVLMLWRTTEEDSLPLGGAVVLPDPSPAFLGALNSILPPFDGQADWAAEFDALAP
jgi:hypothetical protein